MRIGINAAFARKPNTGIGQVTLNFIRELIKFENSKINGGAVEFILYMEEDLPSGFILPENFQKRTFLPIWKRDDLIRKIWWEKYLLPRKTERDACDAFISLYQCPTILNRTRHIMVVHDLIPRLFPEYLDNSRKRAYQGLTEEAIGRADKIIAISKRTEKDLINHLGIDGKKISVSHIDVDQIYKKEVSENKSAKVLKKHGLKTGYIYTGGGLEVRKNSEGVIRAYKYLYEMNKKNRFLENFPKLVISGKMMPELAPLITDVENLVKELNLTKQVILLGFVPQDDLPAIYRNASVFMFPSKYEGFGLPVLEAMNQGVPVIASKTSSLPEVGGDSVLYCNPDDHKDIAMVLKNVLLNKNLRYDLQKKGKGRAAIFSWNNFTKKIFNIAEKNG